MTLVAAPTFRLIKRIYEAVFFSLKRKIRAKTDRLPPRKEEIRAHHGGCVKEQE